MKNLLNCSRIVIAIFFTILACISNGFAGEGPIKHIKLLFTHDLHSYFLPHNVTQADGSVISSGGYARLYTAIRQERAGSENSTLLLDAGDFSMGTLFHTVFRTDALELRLMGEMGYDAGTFGNHDFDFHPGGLAEMLTVAQKRDKKPDMMIANLSFGKKGFKPLEEAFQKYPVTEYRIIEKNGLRIGIFGIMGKDAADDAPFSKPVTFTDPVKAAKRIVSILKNKEKSDLIVCLSHSGTWAVKSHSEDEILARNVPEIDVIISGHTHTVIPKPIVIGKTIIGSAGSYSSYLGVIELKVENGNKTSIAGYRLIPITSEIPEDPVIAGEIQSFKALVEKKYLKPLGYSFDGPIAHSSYGMVSLAYAYEHPGESGLGDLITDAYLYAIRKAEGKKYKPVQLAIEPLGHIRDSIYPGIITTADIFQTLSLGLGLDDQPGYPLISFYITGKEMKDALEVETTIANIKQDAHLQISGVRFEYNPHRLFLDRVTKISAEDEQGNWGPLDQNKLYRICMNYYTGLMMDYVTRVSFGLLSVTPKDQNGLPVKDLKQTVIDGDLIHAGTQEIKEWQALALYLKSQPVLNSKGLPDIPEKYRSPEGRIIVKPSWNPVDLFSHGNGITKGFMLIGLVIVALAAWIAGKIFGKKVK